MRWDGFRRSTNVEDDRDPNKPVDNRLWWFQTLAEMFKLTTSSLAKDAGKDEIK